MSGTMDGRAEGMVRGAGVASAFGLSGSDTLSDLLREAAIVFTAAPATTSPASPAGPSISVMLDPAMRLMGGTGDDTLTGGSGDDTLVGSAGADVMAGSAGSDVADYSRSNAAVVIDLGSSGAQSGGFAAGDTLSGIEALVGSRFADTFLGTSAAERFDGRAGFDWVSYANHTSATVNLSLATQADGDVLSSIEGIIGTSGSDSLVGHKAAEHLVGGGGADELFGSVGKDTLDGSSGTDTVDYSGGGGVTVDLSSSGPQKGGLAFRDVLIDIENVYGSATEANHLKGSAGNNNLYGGSGNDVFQVVSGQDAFYGGAGFDIIDFTNSSVADLMLTVGSHYHYYSGGGAFSVYMYDIEGIIGSSTGNYIDGQSGNDYIDGAGGNDYLSDGAGNDTLLGGDGNDHLTWRGGNDVFIGGAGIDIFSNWGIADGIRIENGVATSTSGTVLLKSIERLVGTSGSDTIYGGSGADILVGGSGSDILKGGLGRDKFQYFASAGDDTILDFNKRMDALELVTSHASSVTIANSGSDKVVSWASGSVTLVGLAKTSFTIDDIVFI